MTDPKPPCCVHLVGSIGLDSVDEVFRTVGPKLGRRLKRIPDGEQGPRRLWVSFQYPFLRSSPFLRPDPSGALRKTSGFPLLCLAEGVSAADLRFGELGYAREARASYQDFVAARARGDSGRFRHAEPPLGETPSTRHMVAIRCTAWCAVTNSNPWTGSRWSPGQTKPRLLPKSRAPRGAA